MDEEFEAFYCLIDTEAYNLAQNFRKLMLSYNPDIRRRTLDYVECLKNNDNAKQTLIKKVNSEVVSLATMKQSLKTMVMNGTRTPPHEQFVISAVNNFISNPDEVIKAIENAHIKQQ